MIPRIRGKLLQFVEPIEWKDKWGFEITIWTFGGETQIGKPIGPFGPFDTEKAAAERMRGACRLACEGFERDAGFEPSGLYIDLKNGAIVRPWDEQ